MECSVNRWVCHVFFASMPLIADVDAGLKAFRDGDYRTAMREWSEAAKHGDAHAEYNLGVLYAKGLGVRPDIDEAMHWYRLAADQGNAQAEFSLGQLYARGWGVPRDDEDALRW